MSFRIIDWLWVFNRLNSVMLGRDKWHWLIIKKLKKRRRRRGGGEWFVWKPDTPPPFFSPPSHLIVLPPTPKSSTPKALPERARKGERGSGRRPVTGDVCRDWRAPGWRWGVVWTSSTRHKNGTITTDVRPDGHWAPCQWPEERLKARQWWRSRRRVRAATGNSSPKP